MTPTTTIAVHTAVATTGVYLIALYLMRAQPALTDSMARLSGPTPPRTGTPATSFIDTLADKTGTRLHPLVLDWKIFTLPDADLKLLNRDPAHVLGEKVVAALLGLLLLPTLNLLLTTVGAALPWTLPAILSLVLAFGLFLVPDADIRRRASAARAEFAQALSTYIDLVALCRRGSMGPTQALDSAAAVGDSWVFLRLDEELYEAGRSGESPAYALTRLARELGIGDLGDLADIMMMTEGQGASIYSSLRARAANLRSRDNSYEQGQAAETTEKLAMPLAGLAGLFIVLLLIPAINLITG